VEALTITHADILDALAAATAAPEGAATVIELAEASGMSIRSVRAALAKLAQKGQLITHRVERPRIDGQRGLVPAYTLLAPPKVTKKRR
jgi:DNA-binding transcriptional ArsR family regulator